MDGTTVVSTVPPRPENSHVTVVRAYPPSQTLIPRIYTRRDPQRARARAIRDLENLGYQVVVTPAAARTPRPTLVLASVATGRDYTPVRITSKSLTPLPPCHLFDDPPFAQMSRHRMSCLQHQRARGWPTQEERAKSASYPRKRRARQELRMRRLMRSRTGTSSVDRESFAHLVSPQK